MSQDEFSRGQAIRANYREMLWADKYQAKRMSQPKKPKWHRVTSFEHNRQIENRLIARKAAEAKRIARNLVRAARRQGLTTAASLLRKSSGGGGGEVQVSAHEREGHPVAAYTRSRPS